MSLHHTVSIIGGTKGLGYRIAQLIRAHWSALPIILTGRNQDDGQEAAAAIDAIYCGSNADAVAQSSIVVFAVPINMTQSVISECASAIQPGAIVADITSIKVGPTKWMSDAVAMLPHGESVIIVPTHPMFGPSISTLHGQTVVLTSDEQVHQQEEYKWFREMLRTLGAHVVETTPETHDRMMSIVQGLTHYSLFALGRAMQKMGVDMGLSQSFVSPIYKLLTTMVGRYVSQDPRLYADIQLINPLNCDVHQAFMAACQELHDVVKNNNRQGFVDIVEETRAHISPWDKEGQRYTDKVIALLSRQSALLQLSIGYKIVIQSVADAVHTQQITLASCTQTTFTDSDGVEYQLDEWIVVG